jgi:hypothetical protein
MKTLRRNFTRRHFLRGAGASLLLPPLASLATRAHAAPAPRRILFVYMPQQHNADFAAGTGTSLSLEGTYCAPLAPVANHVVVVRNLKGRHGHQAGHAEFLTGWPAPTDAGVSFKPVRGPSVDQLIARRLGNATPLPSLELTMVQGTRTTRADSVVSWSDGALVVPPIAEPRRGFERVFGAAAPDHAAAEAAARRLRLRKSLLDGLVADHARISAGLSAHDRRLLDAHTTLLREQEQRLAAEAARPAPSCSAGTAPATTASFPEQLRQHMDTIAAAFRCDATRVATLVLGNAQDSTPYPWVNVRDNFHDIAHDAMGPVSRPKFFAVRRWQMEQLAALAQSLAAVPEGDGTLLDHTTIAVLTELGHFATTGNSHLRARVDALLIGGLGTAPGGRAVDAAGADYGDLLLGFVHHMGFGDVATFGQHGTRALALRSA